jgi:hypothetical protein
LSRGPLIDNKNCELGRDAGAGVENDVVQGSGARWQIALMPFVEARDQQRPKHRDIGPPEGPSCARQRGQRLAPRAEEQNAQQPVTKHVTAFTEHRVIWLKGGLADPEQEMHQGIQKSTCVMRRKIGSRLNRYDDEPEDQSDPGLQDLVAVASQRDRSIAILAARDAARSSHTGLFDRIVRGFTGNHDVMDMALTQAGAADAHETRFLQ